MAAEREHLHPAPAAPRIMPRSATSGSSTTTRPSSFAAVRYSTPPGFVVARVWCREIGDELAVTAMPETGLEEISHHPQSTPGSPRLVDAHHPHRPDGRGTHRPKPKPRTPEGIAFLNLGEDAHRWLVEAGAAGITRVRSKMARAAELAATLGEEDVDGTLRAGSPTTTCPPSSTIWPPRPPSSTWSSRTRSTPFSPDQFLEGVRPVATHPTAPPIPDAPDQILRRMRLPYLRKAPRTCLPPPGPQN
ncbi:hypothetical protein [Streptomyces chartreusis]|uniref:hypothetical protein n=1 Tax=Streptomyces chartreusis TaxID=1969 RepID=UPI0037CF57C5